MSRFDRLIALASRADRLGLAATRLGLVVVLLWIGGPLACRFQAGGSSAYPLAPALGAVLVACGLMVAAHPWLPRLAAVGSFLVLAVSLGTLSFLLTTPDGWVAAAGGPGHGLPLLAGPGRLVIQDALLLGAALVTMADSARASRRVKPATKKPADVVVPIDEWEEAFANRSITSAT
jgi:uncharacterized membrane protein YkgB